jgi:cytochrome c-type biogenesis protein CcmH
MSLESVTAGLEKKLEAAPDDVNGWILLGRSYSALQNWDRAKKIFQQTMAKWPNNADVKVAYAESLMSATNGQVTDEAKQAFEMALAADPSNIRARFNLALYDFQSGKVQDAQDAWVKLAGDLPADSQWRPEIQKGLDEASAKLGTPAPKVVTAAAPPAAAPKGPTPADMAAAGSMSPQERSAFIDSMVEGLKAKLEANPNDRDGWVRLGRSYGVLGRWSDARAAYEAGLKHFPGDEDLAAGLATARSKT